MSKKAKSAKRERKQQLAPVVTLIPRVKKRPRGKPFEKGNEFGRSSRFRKGEPSRNPLGAPRSKEIGAALRKKLASAEKPGSEKTFAEALVDQWVKKGLKGNIAAISGIADRAEGRPPVTVIGDGRADAVTLLIEGMTQRSREIGHPEGDHDRQFQAVIIAMGFVISALH